MKLGLTDHTGAELQTVNKKKGVILKHYTNLELSTISPGDFQYQVAIFLLKALQPTAL